MDLLTLLNDIEDTGLFKRTVRNINTADFEQETVSYMASAGVTVTVNGESTADVSQCCIVFKDGTYYLYLSYWINAGNVGYVDFVVDDIVSIEFAV